MINTSITGRGYAYIGATLGGVVSIAANVAHSFVPPAEAASSWTPHSGAVVGAVFWPIGLFVAVEIFARIAWPIGRRWTLLRFLGLLPVAVVAAVVSYRHLSGLLDFYNEDVLTVSFGPLAVDGLMVMASGALIATGRQKAAPVEPSIVVEAVVQEPRPAASISSMEPSKPAAVESSTTVQPEPSKPPETPPKTPSRKPSTASKTGPKLRGQALLEARVKDAKKALPLWELETPKGPEISSALGISSAQTISDIRKQLTADRLQLVAASTSKEYTP